MAKNREQNRTHHRSFESVAATNSLRISAAGSHSAHRAQMRCLMRSRLTPTKRLKLLNRRTTTLQHPAESVRRVASRKIGRRSRMGVTRSCEGGCRLSVLTSSTFAKPGDVGHGPFLIRTKRPTLGPAQRDSGQASSRGSLSGAPGDTVNGQSPVVSF